MAFINLKIDLSISNASWHEESDTTRYSWTSEAGFLQIAKRNSYPETFVKKTDDFLTLGYGKLQSKNAISDSLDAIRTVNDDEFLTIQVSDNRVEIVRDQLATLPLFIGREQDMLYISNDFSWIAKQLGPTALSVNESALSRYLLLVGMDCQTLFSQIRVVSDCEHITIKHRQPTSTIKELVGVTVQNSNPREFPSRLERVYEKINSSIDLKHSGFEFSGGLDSATVVAGFANYQQLDTYTMMFPGEYLPSQSRKVKDYSNYFSINNHQVHLTEADYPLSRYGNKSSALFYEYQEIYTEQLEKLATLMQEHNKKYVFTGIGGNELFEPYEANKVKDEPLAAPVYQSRFTGTGVYTEAVKDTAAESLRTDLWPRALLAESVVMANASRNNIYIERGIWPISPLANPELFIYSSNLEEKFRIDKMILRGYHEAQAYPKSVYSPEVNENFGKYFENMIKTVFVKRLEVTLQNSTLVERGWADKKRIQSLLEDENSINSDSAIQLFTLAVAELNLKSLT